MFSFFKKKIIKQGFSKQIFTGDIQMRTTMNSRKIMLPEEDLVCWGLKAIVVLTQVTQTWVS